ncbi:histone-lysine N-methyltransferase SETD2 [Ceratobasidium sp. AG-Ba]|nr:histone-lysine N-methyltransferase SETD2 [Ceratobasidium sp. AG-Ba]
MQLIGHLPRAEEEASQQFQEIKENWYQFQTLGRSRNAEEGYACDCHYVRGSTPLYRACGDGSDCINRLTQVECIEGECPSKGHCQNQRFQKRQYASIHIVKTEHKGLGMRAAAPLKKDDFVYEYVGDVVNEAVLRKRMREYAEEGIQHFYFMMLQREQYIDATKRGGKGRFANHSCNPNCYVAKWVVGKRIRMGIFAKRNIEADEELTFNYNVDRYGHDPQKCYCGEANCVGYLGGKTQTDVQANEMLEALGVNGKSRGRDALAIAIEDPQPIEMHEVNNIITALRQMASERTMLLALLKRINLTDADVLREFMRLRTFGMMVGILEENYTDSSVDQEIVELILRSLATWPLLNRGKVEQSNVEEKLKSISGGGDETLRELADELLSKWSTLEESGYRIPKRKNEDILLDAEEARSKRHTASASESPAHDEEETPQPVLTFKATPLLGGGAHRRIGPLPPGGLEAVNGSANGTPTPEPNAPRRPTKSELDAIIARASELNAPIPSPSTGSLSLALGTPTSEGTPRNGLKNKSRDWNKVPFEEREKRMKKLVGEVVVKTLSKWKREISHEQFKKTAKELTDKITETEMRGKNLSSSKFDKLSDEKIEKVKKFVKLSATKLVAKQKKRQQGGSDLEVDTPTNLDLSTPNDGELDTALTTPNGTDSKTPDELLSGPASSVSEMQWSHGSVRG